MKITKIVSSLSAVVPIGAYENLKPGFEIQMDMSDGDDMDAAFKYANEYIRKMLDGVANRAKTDLIEKQYQNIRFYEKDNKKYPSVTSVLGWDDRDKFNMSDAVLAEYGSRGTIVHKLIEHYLTEGKWYDPLEVPELEHDVATLMSGVKKLTWQDCTHEKALASIMPDVKVLNQEIEVYNDEHLYAGRADLVCLYQGKLTLVDWKTGKTSDMRQLAAYASCLKDTVEQMMIVYCGPTDNKSGLRKPVVSTDIAGEYKKFLYSRAKFRERFGI